MSATTDAAIDAAYADAAKTQHEAHQYALGQLEQAVELLGAAKNERDAAQEALREAMTFIGAIAKLVKTDMSKAANDAQWQRWRKAAGEAT